MTARTLLLVIGICLSSCAKTHKAVLPKSELDGKTAFSFEFQVPRLRESDGYVDGNINENYIDIEHNGFRIYLFDMNNRYLAWLNTITVSAVDGTDCREYKVTGVVLDDVTIGSRFKVVILANWPSYPINMETGKTTIDDICTGRMSMFGYRSSFELDASANSLMPFYGVHEYDGITIDDGKCTYLPEPVTLLRAMAKIEIRTTEGSLPITNATLTCANDRGFAAPYHVYHQNDYDKGNYADDYVDGVYVPGNANVLTDVPLRKLQDGRYMLYVPEYDNTSSAALKAQIRLSFADTFAEECLLDFVYYDAASAEKQNANVGDSFDIRRNNYYIYTVNKKRDTELKLIVDVIPYTVVPLPPFFGLTVDEYGNKIDSQGNALVADKDGHVIVKIAPDGTIKTRDGKQVVLDANGHHTETDGTGAVVWTIDKSDNKYLVRDGDGILIATIIHA